MAEREHYLFLSALEAFRNEIRTTGQTLPFDSGEAVATLYVQDGKFYAGIASKENPVTLRVVTMRGSKNIADLVESKAPKIDTSGRLGKWYELKNIPLAPKGDELLLYLKTA